MIQRFRAVVLNPLGWDGIEAVLGALVGVGGTVR
jgi:hypothetical protein